MYARDQSLQINWPKVELTYPLTDHVATHSRARHARTMASDAKGRASKREVLPTRHPPLGIFVIGAHRQGSVRTAGRKERARRPASECEGSIGSTRPVGLEKQPLGRGVLSSPGAHSH
eukprot:6197508-Pleurochrysis_carterae.AAC.5